MTKILFFAGSARTESFNKKLAKAAYGMTQTHDIEATFIDLRDFPMPIYDGDLEASEGLPDNAKKLKKLFIEHDGFLVASPEYNSSFSPLLKNSLDWISRPHMENEPTLAAFKGKIWALTAASPGGFGGLRGLVPLRMMLGNIGAYVLPTQLAISFANKAFDDEGKLTDENHKKTLSTIVEQLVTATAKLSA